MASRKVFETYELLGTILLRLPMLNVLKAKVVSRQWKAVIEDSSPLKQALFLACGSTEYLTFERGVALKELNVPYPFLNNRDCHPPFRYEQLQVDPLFTDVTEVDGDWPRNTLSFNHHRDPKPYQASSAYFHWTSEASNKIVPGTIWHCMHLTEPACTAVYLWLFEHS